MHASVTATDAAGNATTATDDQAYTVDDAAVISGDITSGNVTEAGGVANGTPGTPTATGDLNSTDVDNPADAWTAVSAPAASASGYGSYTLTAAGVWTYTLDNNNADRAGAQRRRHADRQLHGVDRRRHRAARDHHHRRRQRRGRHHRRHHGERGRGRRRGQRHAGHSDRGRGLDAADVDNPSDSLDCNRYADAERQRLRQLHARLQRACGPTRSTTAMPAVQALNVGDTLTDTFTATTVDGTPSW